MLELCTGPEISEVYQERNFKKFENPLTKTEIINYLEGKDKEIMRQEDEILGIDIFPVQKRDTNYNLLRELQFF